ncbi:MAG TPA: IclR family transcriptional regulator [Acidimicrobiales bacterium]|nr:IclR family transcriptional regulator [Acidimicrobiales bacterium]
MDTTVSGIGVLDKIVAILRIVSEGPLSLRQLVERTDLSRATVHRLAQGMEAVGLLRRGEDGAYALGLALIGLGRAALEAYPLTAVAVPVLRRLRDETGESAQLYVAEEGERLCVAAVDSNHELRTIVPVGARLPMGVGSAGRVLSGLADRDGWLASVAERAPGVASVSAPVWDDGQILAAVSVSGPIERVTKRPGQRFGDQVVAAARRIEAAMAHGL